MKDLPENKNVKCMTVIEKIEQIRTKMVQDEVSVYMVTSSDYHDSEYPGAYFETRKYLSGFTGSAGTLVIGTKESALFTDGRYFVQAERELVGSGIKLMRMGVEGTPTLNQYLEKLWQKDTYLAVDTRTISAKAGCDYEKINAKVDGRGILFTEYASHMWDEESSLISEDIKLGDIKLEDIKLEDIELQDIELQDGNMLPIRPMLSKEPAFELELQYAGESRDSKIKRVREFMKKNNAQSHILCTLDDIAWLLNIRGNDIFANPMVMSYVYLDEQQVLWFVDFDKVYDKLKNQLSDDGIVVKAYEDFEEFVKKITATSILYDFSRTNYMVYSSFPKDTHLVAMENPEILMKAIKNPVECENERQAHIKDGVAVTKFIYWLKKNVSKENLDEVVAADYLESLRKQQEGYIEPSFTTISAYNANAAMMHYNPYANTPAQLKPEGILLVDSGGQYYQGTTDITRTIALGPVKEVVKEHYTAVLRGMLNLSAAKFLKGCIGLNLDILARGPLWEMGLDYRCGTGHGVGYLLGVHEAPNGFRWKKVPERDDGCVLQPGMITTDEPGVYIEGSHGIRIENELLTVEDETNEYGTFLHFETLTVAPIEMDLVNLDQMSEGEKDLLRKYQLKVFDTISSYLENEEKEWLYDVCCRF